VYSGIHLRAPAHAFAGWPDGITRAALDPYYARVEQRLAVAEFADAFAFDRTRLFAEGARRAGLPEPRANPLAMQGCTRCGWCVPLCAFGKKRTLPLTYLADPRIRIVAHRKAAYVERAGERYRVHAWRTDGVARDYHRVAGGPLDTFAADIVVIAGGAIESPALLERSLAHLAAFPTDRLGHGIDGTGDFVQGGLLPQRIDGFRGAVMMAHVDMGDYVLEDIHGVPIAAVTLGTRAPGVAKDWGADYLASFRDYARRALGIAIVGKGGAGTIRVRDDAGNAAVDGRAYAPPAGALDAARAIIRALGGEPAQTPWELHGQAFTVHPTGGCASVVRPRDFQLANNPGVYVIDGSVLPGNPLRNPSHTIAALAERALDAILG
jgi:cholesterol oxidase